MSSVSSEVVWLQRLLMELVVPCSQPITLFGDNTSAISIATNPLHHERTKHIEVDFHYIRELVQDKILSLVHVSSHEQIADLFTKPMSYAHHSYLVSKLMLVDNYHQFERGYQNEKILAAIKDKNDSMNPNL